MKDIVAAKALTRVHDTDGAAVHALRGVDLTVKQGEFVAITGPSGCGKSTLLHLLGGLDRPTSGEIYIGGQRVDTLSEAAWAVLRRQRIGYMFQFFNLITNMSAAENVELPALMAGSSSEEARERRKRLMGQLDIADKADLAPGRMSGGQQQRVALARAMINSPDILLIDEPTGNLDSQSAQEVIEVLKECNRQGQTIVMVTHDPGVASAGHRIVLMRDGQIIGEER